MTVGELKEYLSGCDDSHQVLIPVVTRGQMCLTNTVGIAMVTHGFDWDSKRVFLHPDKNIADVTKEEVSQIVKSVQLGHSWHSMQMVDKIRESIVVDCPHCGAVLDEKEKKRRDLRKRSGR